ncbi:MULTISPECIES: hypothetical protein [unclassified Legionella]|uniref:hypothetical protein n=1 Tax=unclassified Legionella TaxID=2622702 RepID=UPI0010548FFE|nr:MULTISPECIES: hypothetical protein [unclassified Legionella]MDI9818625.1 hypothetical protein [Legionella sp. PL877]
MFKYFSNNNGHYFKFGTDETGILSFFMLEKEHWKKMPIVSGKKLEAHCEYQLAAPDNQSFSLICANFKDSKNYLLLKIETHSKGYACGTNFLNLSEIESEELLLKLADYPDLGQENQIPASSELKGKEKMSSLETSGEKTSNDSTDLDPIDLVLSSSEDSEEAEEITKPSPDSIEASNNARRYNLSWWQKFHLLKHKEALEGRKTSYRIPFFPKGYPREDKIREIDNLLQDKEANRAIVEQGKTGSILKKMS